MINVVNSWTAGQKKQWGITSSKSYIPGTNCCIQLDYIFIRWRSIGWDDMTFNIITFKELMTDVSTTFYKPLTYMKPDSSIDILDISILSIYQCKRLWKYAAIYSPIDNKNQSSFFVRSVWTVSMRFSRHKQASESK